MGTANGAILMVIACQGLLRPVDPYSGTSKIVLCHKWIGFHCEFNIVMFTMNGYSKKPDLIFVILCSTLSGCSAMLFILLLMLAADCGPAEK